MQQMAGVPPRVSVGELPVAVGGGVMLPGGGEHCGPYRQFSGMFAELVYGGLVAGR
jgi:hypothetical protein